jgi:putative membrane protein
MADKSNTGFLRRWIFTSVGVLAAAQIVPGIECEGWGTLLITALVLGIFNAFLKPILFLLTLPLQLITLGLFTLVINALLLMLTGQLVREFYVDGFWAAFFGSLVISIVGGFLNALFGGGGRRVEAHVHTAAGQPAPNRRDVPPGKGPIIDV